MHAAATPRGLCTGLNATGTVRAVQYPARASDSAVSSALPQRRVNTGGHSTITLTGRFASIPLTHTRRSVENARIIIRCSGATTHGPQLYFKMFHHHRRVPSAASWRTLLGASENDNSQSCMMSSSALVERKSSLDGFIYIHVHRSARCKACARLFLVLTL